MSNVRDYKLFFLSPESFQDQSVSDHLVHTLNDQLPKSTWLFLLVEQSTGTNNLKKKKLMLKIKTDVRLEIYSSPKTDFFPDKIFHRGCSY